MQGFWGQRGKKEEEEAGCRQDKLHCFDSCGQVKVDDMTGSVLCDHLINNG